MDAQPKEFPPLRDLFVNRELSWLEFNRRVLLESVEDTVPLYERLKFAAIYASNLDEFFMVRVGTLSDQAQIDPTRCDDKSGMTAAEQIAAIFEWVQSIESLREHTYTQLRRKLGLEGIDILDFTKIPKVEEVIAQKYFKDELKPLLSPQIVDRHHPFPFLKNKEQYVAVSFGSKGGDIKLGIVPVSHLPLYHVLNLEDRQKVMFTADVVRHYAHALYSKYEIVERVVIRVTRNADISVDEGLYDYDEDFRGIMQELLKKRRRLRAVRLQISAAPSEPFRRYICQKLNIQSEHVLTDSTPLDFSFGFSLPRDLRAPRPDMTYREQRPVMPTKLGSKPVMRYLAEDDLLLAYPYHGMNPFINLLHEAAEDPTVISIKISLYRLANHSRVVSALAYAAEKGKEILCVLELRARFDEQNNIDYAKLLEDAGCTVIYGLVDYKIHAKLCLITRRAHNNSISYITQIGTGNYNEKTAEQYTDLAFITSAEDVGKDAAEVFSALCVGETVADTRTLWVAPNRYLSLVISFIQREIDVQEGGGEGFISIKVNSLNDMEVMNKLCDASRAGVEVELFVRGICCLRPGVEGYTDNITVKSVVGRYLEHSRIYIFGRGESQVVYIGSGDLLNRNTRRRVEVFAPVRSSRAKADVLRVQDAFRRDNAKAWTMLPDGTYYKPERGDAPPLESQEFLRGCFTTVPAPAEAPHTGILDKFLDKLRRH